MATIQKQQTVEFSPEQMFDLVNDIDAYPKFLSWCHKAEVIYQDESEIIGKLSLRMGILSQSFTTKNQLNRPHNILISLVEGPFSSLEGCWEFVPSDLGYTEVKLTLAFEFARNPLLATTFGVVMEKIGNELVSAFVKRAEQVYGKDTY